MQHFCLRPRAHARTNASKLPRCPATPFQCCGCCQGSHPSNEAELTSPQRVLVDAVRRYGERHAISVDVRSDGWLIVMSEGAPAHLVFGYDVGLNSAVARGVANDKAATAELLAHLRRHLRSAHAVPPIRGSMRTSPPRASLAGDVGSAGAASRRHRGQTQRGDVGPIPSFWCRCRAATRIERSGTSSPRTASLAISPYPRHRGRGPRGRARRRPCSWSTRKNRPAVVGDGRQTLLELAIAATPAAQRSLVLARSGSRPHQIRTRCHRAAGQRRVLHWRHNLDAGARPVLLEAGRHTRGLRPARRQGGARDRASLRIGRRCPGRRPLAYPRDQSGRDDGAAGGLSSRSGRRCLCGGIGQGVRIRRTTRVVTTKAGAPDRHRLGWSGVFGARIISTLALLRSLSRSCGQVDRIWRFGRLRKCTAFMVRDARFRRLLTTRVQDFAAKHGLILRSPPRRASRRMAAEDCALGFFSNAIALPRIGELKLAGEGAGEGARQCKLGMIGTRKSTA